MVRGTKLGPYEILEPLGAGGMGEVYKARDTRLNRTVAIKVLGSRVAADAELRQRLEQEARTISSLNHPHICSLFDIGHQDGIDFLVLEYIEGETLADRLKKGPLPLDAALRYAMEMAGALDQAHRAGIVHRDLKPGNVMLTKAGTKLLDFGLAKFRGARRQQAEETVPLTRDLTGEGKIVGTLQYMSPEQLEGKEADARSDMFAFGAVIYEMVTGQRAFEGTSQASLIASIIKSDPPLISAVQPLTPASLDRLIGSCLAKDPEDRWQSAGDFGRALKWIGERTAEPAVRDSTRKLVGTAAAAVIALAALAVVSWKHFSEKPAVGESIRFTIPTKAGLPARVNISPDGKHLAFIGQNAQGTVTLWVRPLDKPDAVALAGTDGANYPFWSPDSRQIGFFSDGRLKKIDLLGGQPQTLCESLKGDLGGDWGRDGTILFSVDGNKRDGIFRVSSQGGIPVRVTTPERPSVGHAYPVVLPDGKHFLYLSRGYLDRGTKSVEMVGSLDGTPPVALVETQYSAKFSTGFNGSPSYVLFGRDNALMAQEIDLNSLRLKGEPVRVADSMATDGVYSYADVSVSGTGVLAYNSAVNQHELIWLDRSGNRMGAGMPVDRYAHPKLTADGKTALFEKVDPGATDFSIWKLNVERGEWSLLQKEAAGTPVPYPDGANVVFRCVVDGVSKICRKAMGGAGTTDVLWESGKLAAPVDISSDARYLSFAEPAPAIVWILPLTGEKKPHRFDATESYQRHGTFSPNVKYFAYTSNETGEMEVYVQPFPASGEKWKVSSHGGAQPRWRRDGAELFYRTAEGRMMAVAVKTSGKFEAGVPHELFQSSADPLFPNLGLSYDVSADGQRFLMNSAVDASRNSPITVITNWRQMLKK